MQHFGYVVYFFCKSRCNEPPVREIRDNMGAIRSFWTIFCLGQNRGHYNLKRLNFYGMFKLREYWTRARCNIVHLLQGKEVRSFYFVFVHTKSLLKDGHSARLSNLNPLSIARAGPLFLHMKNWFQTLLR